MNKKCRGWRHHRATCNHCVSWHPRQDTSAFGRWQASLWQWRCRVVCCGSCKQPTPACRLRCSSRSRYTGFRVAPSALPTFPGNTPLPALQPQSWLSVVSMQTRSLPESTNPTLAASAPQHGDVRPLPTTALWHSQHGSWRQRICPGGDTAILVVALGCQLHRAGPLEALNNSIAGQPCEGLHTSMCILFVSLCLALRDLPCRAAYDTQQPVWWWP